MFLVIDPDSPEVPTVIDVLTPGDADELLSWGYGVYCVNKDGKFKQLDPINEYGNGWDYKWIELEVES